MISPLKNSFRKKSNGFTLIEVLIALAVFALLATITTAALQHTFSVQQRIEAQAEELSELQFAIALLRQDTKQMTDRAVRGNDLHLFAPFIGQNKYVEFTRNSMLNPNFADTRSALGRVAWICKNNQLIRRTWPVLDTPRRQDFQDKILLNHLLECQFNYMAHNHQILATWQAYALQQNQHGASLPIAIRIDLTIQKWGAMQLLLSIPVGLYGD